MSNDDILKALSRKLNELKQELSDTLTTSEDGDALLKAAQEDEEKKYQIPKSLPVLPIREILVFPYMVVPLLIGRELSIKSVEEAMAAGRKILLATQKDARNENPGEADICEYGIAAEILQLLKLPDGTVKVLVEGLKRVKITKVIIENSRIKGADIEPVAEILSDAPEFEALKRSVIEQFEKYVKLNRKIPVEIMMVISNTDDASRLADVITAHLTININTKQSIIEAIDVHKRFSILLKIISKEVEILTLEKKIRSRVHEQLEKTQKEYYLREQIKVLQKELGEDESLSGEAEEYRKKLKKIKMPEECVEKIDKEIARLAKMHPMSAETSVMRTYLDWVIELPWNSETKDNADLKKSENILEEDHYGLEKVKERIIEFLAVKKLAGDKMKCPILCLVGPPGVGKTSLGRSIARSLERKFVRISLGGMRDEAEIRGHRRTYVGALPGKIMQHIHQSKTKNPVFLLDEIDKLASDFRGDPASALLETLDPEQNSSFTDHYINLPFDLSKVFFITTANLAYNIPAPLLDRMEVIRISGYTEDEKLNIAQKYLAPKQIGETGLSEFAPRFSDDAVRHIIRHYTREAGVRNLEREIGSILRKYARVIAAGKKPKSALIDIAEVEKHLGAKKFKYGEKDLSDGIGIVNGLAWSEAGGSVLKIESAMMEGKGALNLTGQLGNVMQESAKAAFAYIKSNAKSLGINSSVFKSHDFHVHVPEGATPKDGPSAGIALCSSLVSLITKKPARGDIAMTGEITLTGIVLPIGGVKEKVLAASASGITTVILPDDNRKDLEEIPGNVLKKLKIKFVKNISEVIKVLIRK
ncbi:MAG TPA: endopeptidase La [Candidatus Wallbacteria bacterium]|nr:endopeptidase La [Candidatus Wallbacteria bacterium]